MRTARAWPGALLCAAAVAAGYAWSLTGPFVFDDPLPDARFDYRTRTLVWLSFDLNRRISGAATWSYHLFNVLLHLACGLVLLGVLRRALALVSPGLAPLTRARAALAAALLWLCHPLQTSAVAYVSQRAEALAALFYLGTLYGFLRAVAAGRGRGWQALALASLALGFACKETIATAPFVLLLAEVALLPGGVREHLARRWRFHLLTWLWAGVLGALFVLPPLFAEDSSSGFGAHEHFGPLEYARSQPGVILHYLRLALWPHPLVFDYGWPIAESARDWVPQTLALAVLAAAALGLVARRSGVGFALASFLAILAPTSSIVPIKDLAFEHRMYLPLAALTALGTVGAWRGCTRWLPPARALPPALTAAAVLLLLGLTARRNLDYRSAVALWRTVVERAPGNARGHNNLGAALIEAGREAEAEAELETALRLDPRSGYAHRNLGVLAAQRGELDRAIEHLQRAVGLTGAAADHANLGRVLVRRGDDAAAEPHLRRALELDPRDGDVRSALAGVLLRRGETEEARRLLSR